MLQKCDTKKYNNQTKEKKGHTASIQAYKSPTLDKSLNNKAFPSKIDRPTNHVSPIIAPFIVSSNTNLVKILAKISSIIRK